jgi:hypothetical protein
LMKPAASKTGSTALSTPVVSYAMVLRYSSG